MEASTGSLGHGLPIGLGIALSSRLKKTKYRVFCVVGDGEINEGSFWEASMMASKHNLENLFVIVDYNKIQSYGKTEEVLDLEPLKDKLSSFGYIVGETDGHDIKKIEKKIKFLLNKKKKPKALICHTTKGKGFPFAENNPFWHHKNFFTEEERKNLKKFVKYK